MIVSAHRPTKDGMVGAYDYENFEEEAFFYQMNIYLYEFLLSVTD